MATMPTVVSCSVGVGLMTPLLLHWVFSDMPAGPSGGGTAVKAILGVCRSHVQ